MDICFDNQEQFIFSAFRFYRRKIEYLGWISHQEDDVEWLYKLGRDYNILSMDYTEFRRILRGEHKDYSYWNGIRYYRRQNRRKYHNSRSHYCRIEEYRVLKGFTRNGQVKKNKPTKNDWWEHKGIVRDRRKAMYGRYRSWRQYFKHFNKRKHRQLEREAIKHERYDKLHRRTYKQADDPWGWD